MPSLAFGDLFCMKFDVYAKCPSVNIISRSGIFLSFSIILVPKRNICHGATDRTRSGGSGLTCRVKCVDAQLRNLDDAEGYILLRFSWKSHICDI
jgi:hypothetical protein